MNGQVERTTAWIYQGVWGVLAHWFRVPEEPPRLPALAGETIETFRPANGFLRYLKFQFWILLAIIDLLILIAWVIITVSAPEIGLIIAPLALLVAVVPDIVAYVAIHLRYDTTWYVMSDRSLRIRRGIWIIHETTITYENVQNVTVTQGPLQRFFGIADLSVETAGGGGGGEARHAHSGAATGNAHLGLIEGVADAPRIRELLMERLKQSRAAGLGDDAPTTSRERSLWTPAHIAALREIRDLAGRLVDAPPAAP